MKNLDIVSRMRILMEFDSSKTVKENTVILEQPSPNKVPNQQQLNQISHCKSTPRDYNYFAPYAKDTVDKTCQNLSYSFPTYYSNTEPYQYSQSEIQQQQIAQQPKSNISVEFERQNKIVNSKTPPNPPTKYNEDILTKPGTKLPKKPWGKYYGELGNYDELYVKYKKDLKDWYVKNKPNDEWYKNNPQYIMGPDGYPTYATLDKRKVPPGFHEDEYDEYIKKKNELEYKRKQNLNNFELYNQISLELQKLKTEYYHEEFPFGIKKEDYERWKEAEAQLDNEYENQKELTAKSGERELEKQKMIGATDYLGKGGQFEKNLGFSQEQLDTTWYFLKIQEVRNQYGYVSTEKPEEHSLYEFWEWGPHEWLMFGSIAVWFVPGLNTAAPFIAAALDITDAVLYLEEGNMEMAGLSLLFAAVPFIGSVPGVKQVSQATVKAITKKISQRQVLQTWEMKIVQSIADNKNALMNGLQSLTQRGINAIPQSMKPAANIMIKTGTVLIKPPLVLAKAGLKASPVLAGYGAVALGYMGAYEKIFREGTPQQIATELGYDWNLIKTEFKSNGSKEDNLLLKKALSLGWKPGLPIPLDCWTNSYKQSLEDIEKVKQETIAFWKEEMRKVKEGDIKTIEKYSAATEEYINQNKEEVEKQAQEEIDKLLSPDIMKDRIKSVQDSVINSNQAEWEKLFGEPNNGAKPIIKKDKIKF